jgi:limonene-1,2-epoxide hydrolase
MEATTTIENLIKEIGTFNNAVFTERIDTKNEIIIKFEATVFASNGISYLFKKNYGIRVLTWVGTNEYFFVIKKRKDLPK